MSDTLSCAQSGPADASTRDRILALLREAASGTGEGWRSGEEISCPARPEPGRREQACADAARTRFSH